MKNILVFLLIIAFGFVGIGCDSDSDDDPSIAELLEGDWVLTDVTDDAGDQFAVFIAGFNSIEMLFTESGSFTIDVDAVDSENDQTISGSFSVSESTSKLTLTATVPPFGPIQLTFTYAFFSGDDQVTLTADSLTSTL
ncbi:MAG: hypothetical protein E2O85_06330, partial [Bacteroidetes bacterium]